MNPFDLPGPEFLFFYAGFSALVIIALILLRKNHESSPPPKFDLSDPYLIAYLRGGHDETLRVAVVNLIDRGLLTVNGTCVTAAENASPDLVRRPVEKELLRRFKKVNEVGSIFNDPGLKSTSEAYEKTLRDAGLLPNESIVSARWTRLLLACLLLGGVGVVKILIAFERGRTNVGFLIVLTIVAIIVAVKVSFPGVTESGKAMIADVQNLYSELKDRAFMLEPGGATIEALMLASAFGIGALEGSGFAYTRVLFPRAVAPKSSSSATNSGCGSGSCGTAYSPAYDPGGGISFGDSGSSSCGSSSGSSCGGGCGGGGCGGCGG